MADDDGDMGEERGEGTLATRLAAREQELDRAHRELAEIGRVVSHDMRAPLRAITSFGALLADEHGDALDDEGKEFLAFVTDGAERMQAMVDGLLTLLRLEGHQESPSEVALTDVFEEVGLDARKRLQARTGSLIVTGEFGRVRGIHVQLVQLFQNLVDNAIKFSKEAPEITVVGRIEDGIAVVAVRDEGIGFPPQATAQIFGLFERAVTREQFEGAGVGLSICKKVVEGHGGTIEAHGKLGEGARFVVRLPLARKRDPSPL